MKKFAINDEKIIDNVIDLSFLAKQLAFVS